MPIKSSDGLVAAAKSAIPSVSVDELKELLAQGACAVVDVRDGSELDARPPIPGATHASRGMLEFHVDPASDFHLPVFAADTSVVFVCGSGGRASLAAETARAMGLADVRYLEGGMKAWEAETD